MHAQYLPKPGEKGAKCAHLIEEGVEVVREVCNVSEAVAKIARFGLDNRYPDGDPTNKEKLIAAVKKLRDEIQDLDAAAAAVQMEYNT